MRSSIGNFQLIRPRDLEEALDVLSSGLGSGSFIPIAGCTDVYVQLEFGQTPGTRYMDIWGLSELRGIRVEGDVLRVGALTTYTQMIRSPHMR